MTWLELRITLPGKKERWRGKEGRKLGIYGGKNSKIKAVVCCDAAQMSEWQRESGEEGVCEFSDKIESLRGTITLLPLGITEHLR